jgi:Cft2 family RNA processing exonuclease
MEKIESNFIQNADRDYISAVFEALMNFQTIEDLLKQCILASYEILAKTTPPELEFRPSKQDIKRIKNNLGLGGLINKFEELTPNKELCEKIRASSKIRNELAHKAAANYLNFLPSNSGAQQAILETKKYDEASKLANYLYYELNDVYEAIMLVHGEKV